MRKYANGSEGKVGMRIIVGQDEQENLDRYASTLGGKVFFDNDGSYYRSIAGKSVPFWIVSDQAGREIRRVSGAPAGLPLDRLVDHLVDRELKLSDFL